MPPHRTLSLLAAGALFLVILGCSNNNGSGPVAPSAAPLPDLGDPTAPGHFADKTAQSGIKFIFKNGEEAGHFAILESLGGGAAAIDYDRDGRIDLFFAGGGFYAGKKTQGHPCALFRNEGNWVFREVTKDVGLDQIPFYSHGAAVSDYDNDGWADLLVTGYGRMALFHNDKGKFTDVTVAAGFPIDQEWHWSTSAAFADFNGDGFADLFVTHYVNWSLTKNHPKCEDSSGKIRDVCSPKRYDGLPHYLYLNNGKGGFVDVSKDAVEERSGDKVIYTRIKSSKGLGVVVADLNRDGKPDIFVANDTVDNHLYLNQGGMKFAEMGLQLGVARDENNTPNGSMGVGAADYDGSGRFSLFVTNYQHEAHQLHRNRGDGPFHHASTRAGILQIGLVYVAFGTGFIDYDLDGAEDIFILNGHVVRNPPPPGTLKQRPVLLKNLRQPGEEPHAVRFKETTKDGGPVFFQFHMGRGCVFADFDNDGKVDIVLCRMNEPAALLRNETKTDNHWLGIQLEGKTYKDAGNAVLILETEVEHKGQKQVQKLHRQILGGGSYLSAHDLRVVFGLSSELKTVPKSLTIKWPSGATERIPGGAFELGRYWKVTEGNLEPQEISAK